MMSTPPEPYSLPNPTPQPSPPPRRKHWWRDAGPGERITIVGAVIGIALVAALAVATLLGVKLGGGAPDDITFTVQSCQFTSGSLPSVTAEFTATNTGDTDKRIRIRWEYRDSSGARIDTDTTRITVPAGDTIRDSETTLLPVSVTGGRCLYSVS